jgi:Rieske Fe-S protein
MTGGLDLAGGIHLAAFSRVCTHLSCIVELKRDTEAVAFAFNHRSDHPSLTCACHFSVFDPSAPGAPSAVPLYDRCRAPACGWPASSARSTHASSPTASNAAS